MCDRTKEEILARELCIQFWLGMQTVSNKSISKYTEDNWEKYQLDAKKLLALLEKHK